MVRKKLLVRNRTGFHVFPARSVANAAESCTSRVVILYRNHIINAKSLLNLLSAAIKFGAEIEVCCEGDREEEDLRKMVGVIENLKD